MRYQVEGLPRLRRYVVTHIPIWPIVPHYSKHFVQPATVPLADVRYHTLSQTTTTPPTPDRLTQSDSLGRGEAEGPSCRRTGPVMACNRIRLERGHIPEEQRPPTTEPTSTSTQQK